MSRVVATAIHMSTSIRRVRIFLIVGAIGFGVQLASFALLTQVVRLPLLVATAASVIIAVFHNFVWHAHWTWRDRAGGRAIRKLVNFTVATGSSSLVSNVLFMSLFAGVCHVNPLVATVLAVVSTSIVNYVLCDRCVFG